MSLSLEVIRGLGDKTGPQIVCRYFTSEAVFRQCGRVAIDKSEKGLILTSITLPGMRTHVRPGEVNRIIDVATEYRCKVKSIMYSVGRQPDGTPYAVCSQSLRAKEIK